MINHMGSIAIFIYQKIRNITAWIVELALKKSFDEEHLEI